MVTILSKMVIFGIIDSYEMGDMWYYFTYGREFITSLDNFVVGMVLGRFLLLKREETERIRNNLRGVFGIILSMVMIGVLIRICQSRNLWANTKTAWVWCSCLALVLGYLIWNIANLKIDLKGKFSSVLLWIAKYEYGIYLWHIVIIYNLYGKSLWMQQIAQKSYIISAAVILLISCAAGYISTEGIDNGIMKKLKKKK